MKNTIKVFKILKQEMNLFKMVLPKVIPSYIHSVGLQHNDKYGPLLTNKSIFKYSNWNQNKIFNIFSNNTNEEDSVIQEMHHKIQEWDKKIANNNYQDVVLLLGSTRQGKSTLFNYLANKKLIAKKDKHGDIKIDLENPKDGSADIGHGGLSKTKFPNEYFDTQNNITYFDCPGFSDNRGNEQDIVNAYYISTLFGISQRIKIILTVPSNTQDTIVLDGLVNNLSTLFGKSSDKITLGIVQVVTKTTRDSDYYKKKFASDIDEKLELPTGKDNEVKILKVLQDSPLCIFPVPVSEGNISDTYRNEILSLLNKSQYIAPKDLEVSPPISDKAKNFISKLKNISVEAIRKSLEDYCSEVIMVGKDTKSLSELFDLFNKFDDVVSKSNVSSFKDFSVQIIKFKDALQDELEIADINNHFMEIVKHSKHIYFFEGIDNNPAIKTNVGYLHSAIINSVNDLKVKLKEKCEQFVKNKTNDINSDLETFTNNLKEYFEKQIVQKHQSNIQDLVENISFFNAYVNQITRIVTDSIINNKNTSLIEKIDLRKSLLENLIKISKDKIDDLSVLSKTLEKLEQMKAFIDKMQKTTLESKAIIEIFEQSVCDNMFNHLKTQLDLIQKTVFDACKDNILIFVGDIEKNISGSLDAFKAFMEKYYDKICTSTNEYDSLVSLKSFIDKFKTNIRFDDNNSLNQIFEIIYSFIKTQMPIVDVNQNLLNNFETLNQNMAFIDKFKKDFAEVSTRIGNAKGSFIKDVDIFQGVLVSKVDKKQDKVCNDLKDSLGQHQGGLFSYLNLFYANKLDEIHHSERTQQESLKIFLKEFLNCMSKVQESIKTSNLLESIRIFEDKIKNIDGAQGVSIYIARIKESIDKYYKITKNHIDNSVFKDSMKKSYDDMKNNNMKNIVKNEIKGYFDDVIGNFKKYLNGQNEQYKNLKSHIQELEEIDTQFGKILNLKEGNSWHIKKIVEYFKYMKVASSHVENNKLIKQIDDRVQEHELDLVETYVINSLLDFKKQVSHNKDWYKVLKQIYQQISHAQVHDKVFIKNLEEHFLQNKNLDDLKRIFKNIPGIDKITFDDTKLVELKDIAKTVTGSEHHFYNHNSLTLYGHTSSLSNIKKKLTQAEHLNMYFTHSFILDTDLGVHDTNVVIFAPKLILKDRVLVDVSGSKGDDYKSAAQDSMWYDDNTGIGDKGEDGKPGSPGKKGGIVYIFTKNIEGEYKINVNISGGSGGCGQKGGNGGIGKDGKNADIPLIDDALAGKFGEPISTKSKNIPGTNTQYAEEVQYLVPGILGKQGGDAGIGGKGGYKGNHGYIILKIMGNGNEHYVIKELQVSTDGINGSSGISGNGGKNGNDIISTYNIGKVDLSEGQGLLKSLFAHLMNKNAADLIANLGTKPLEWFMNKGITNFKHEHELKDKGFAKQGNNWRDKKSDKDIQLPEKQIDKQEFIVAQNQKIKKFYEELIAKDAEYYKYNQELYIDHMQLLGDLNNYELNNYKFIE